MRPTTDDGEQQRRGEGAVRKQADDVEALDVRRGDVDDVPVGLVASWNGQDESRFRSHSRKV
jgi:hypothetical protein